MKPSLRTLLLLAVVIASIPRAAWANIPPPPWGASGSAS
jgi:hypothetical protein